MHRFFTEPSRVHETVIEIGGPDVNHIKNVLRMKPGEEVEISDGAGKEYLCEIDRYEEEAVILRILSSAGEPAELPSKIYLFQGLPKSDKIELIIQKAVELGVYEVIPVGTNRAVVKLDEKKAAKKTERWNAIALSAAKQCGRSIIPQVTQVKSFGAALEYAAGLDIVLIPYELAKGMEETKQLISSVEPGQSIGIFIGPEGGFEEEEIEKAVNMGALPITLGRRILRTETAGLTILSILMYHLEPSV